MKDHPENGMFNNCDNLIDSNGLNSYIIQNKLTEEYSYQDPFNGNTLYHEIIKESNYGCLKDLIEENLFDFTILNNDNKTPIELCSNQDVSNLLINYLYEKSNSQQQRIDLLEKNILSLQKELTNQTQTNIINNISLYNFIKTKLYIFYKKT